MDLNELKQSQRILFECRAGSFAYGTNTPKSDTDIKGIFLVSKDELLSFNDVPDQINDQNNDVTYYNLRRYIELASSANPNILELLFMPDDCVLKSSEVFDELKKYRKEFVTKKCLETHQAYALAQIKKAKGRNKWINNPQPKEQPKIENFAYFIASENNSKTPGRPVKYTKSPVKEKNIKASSVEHCPGLYRIYESTEKAGVFTENQIYCSSIPYEEEKKSFIGFLYFNEDAYKKALTDHKNYWGWIEKRNPQRWKLQECEELDFDAKNMQHTIRLLLTAKNIVSSGEVKVRFEGEELKYLKSIREGSLSYKELIEYSEILNNEIEQLSLNANLPDEMSSQRASEIFLLLMNLK